ncbi:hypothetical protein SUGI_0948660 [Cryptomeria japonica]|nr:hypothetical protein SUGI_0948660 [Cryptomeria japonica]
MLLITGEGQGSRGSSPDGGEGQGSRGSSPDGGLGRRKAFKRLVDFVQDKLALLSAATTCKFYIKLLNIRSLCHFSLFCKKIIPYTGKLRWLSSFVWRA